MRQQPNVSNRPLRPAMAALALFILVGCGLPEREAGAGPEQNQAIAAAAPPLLLISIDGFRHDYFGRTELPALERLIGEGLKVDSLQHVFPTKTFSTHYALVTGLYAENTGVVANSMWDPDRQARFSLGNRDAVGDGYWYDGEPIWNTVEKARRVAATYFWPGSEARIDGIRPSHWKPYAGDTSHDDRIDQVLRWLDLPAGERPDFLTLYFSVVDSVGHSRGPSDPAVDRAMEEVDRALGLLIDGLEARGLLGNIHILVSSDHGMTRIDMDRYILLDEYLDLSKVRVSDWGPAAQIWAGDLSAEEIFAALNGAHPRMRVWKREDVPARYHFRDHRRIAHVVAEADLGWMISNQPYLAGMRRGQLNGMHGWDPAWLEMHGIFIAHGPAFAAGTALPAQRSVDLYSLMAALLDLEPAETDGSLEAFAPVLANPASARVETTAWDCGGEHFVARTGPGSAALHYGGRTYALPRADSASGVRYADTGVTFWSKGEEARIEIEAQDWRDCAAMDEARDWAEAVVAGRAFGRFVPPGPVLTVAETESAIDGQTVVLEGRIVQVCQNRGCWAAFAEGERLVRVMAVDHGFALPFEAAGTARAHGRLERRELSPEHVRHLIEDDGANPALAEDPVEWRLFADGIVLLD